jgi:hypothetical protein
MASALAVSWTIASGVRASAELATREYRGDTVSSLVAFAASPSHGVGDRNRAVWALGQLGDARALAFLERHYTGKACDHSRGLCQRELKKAVDLCRGGLNLPALLWRRGQVTREEARPRG